MRFIESEARQYELWEDLGDWLTGAGHPGIVNSLVELSELVYGRSKPKSVQAYRGIRLPSGSALDHILDNKPITSKNPSSWSYDIETAEEFASPSRAEVGLVVSRKLSSREIILDMTSRKLEDALKKAQSIMYSSDIEEIVEFYANQREIIANPGIILKPFDDGHSLSLDLGGLPERTKDRFYDFVEGDIEEWGVNPWTTFRVTSRGRLEYVRE